MSDYIWTAILSPMVDFLQMATTGRMRMCKPQNSGENYMRKVEKQKRERTYFHLHCARVCISFIIMENGFQL